VEAAVSHLELVREFHRAMGQPVASAPSPLTVERRRLRMALIIEEVAELAEAMGSEGLLVHILNSALRAVQHDDFSGPMDLVESADACGDIVYVVLGTEVEAGLPGDDVFSEIHRSNLAKAGGTVSELGKLEKPPGWMPPDIASVLQRAKARAIGIEAGAAAVASGLPKADWAPVTIAGMPVTVGDCGRYDGLFVTTTVTPRVPRYDGIEPPIESHPALPVSDEGWQTLVRDAVAKAPDEQAWRNLGEIVARAHSEQPVAEVLGCDVRLSDIDDRDINPANRTIGIGDRVEATDPDGFVHVGTVRALDVVEVEFPGGRRAMDPARVRRVG
jgi:predicted HAD superfamily Cof-like phosphohydrolase